MGMATILNEEPNWRSVRRSKYPWATWLDGQTWHLKAGEDFAGAVGAIRSAAANAAKQRGLDLKTMLTAEGDLILRAAKRVVEGVAESTPEQG